MSLLSPELRAEDLAACRAILARGSRSFRAAALLLPRRVGKAAVALYAFCRIADDAIDNDGAAAALPLLRERLARAYAGRPAPVPTDRALAWVVAHHAIPRALPEALLEGFAWDAEGRRYDTLAELTSYAARVAGTVGAMMALLMGVRDKAAIARACDLGIAMQFGNIARDVGEDARAGRLYLPRAWLRAEGIAPDAFVASPAFSPALGRVVQRLLGEAEVLYARADAGIAALPAACRPGIAAARLIYAEIGRRIERTGGDSVSARAVVPGGRKLALLARSTLHAARVRAAEAAPLAEARFLVDAVAGAPAPLRAASPPLWPALDARAEWLVALFLRLNASEAMAREG